MKIVLNVFFSHHLIHCILTIYLFNLLYSLYICQMVGEINIGNDSNRKSERQKGYYTVLHVYIIITRQLKTREPI